MNYLHELGCVCLLLIIIITFLDDPFGKLNSMLMFANLTVSYLILAVLDVKFDYANHGGSEQ